VSQHAQIVKQSQRLVANTFYGTMLKQMRESPFKSKLFDGGRGGEAFSTMLDQHLADHMAGGKSSQKLVNSVVKSIEKHAKARENAKAKEKPEPAKKAATRALFNRSGYSKQPAKGGRPYVPADIRA
jgi:Rod binding domain-containing protein